jgi:hypothetical protein
MVADAVAGAVSGAMPVAQNPPLSTFVASKLPIPTRITHLDA